MPAKPPVCCGETAVVVSVYVEKPRRSVVSSNSNRRHRHHHQPHVRQRIIHHRIGGGYDRRADLLLYSQQLRQAVRSQSTDSMMSVQRSPSLYSIQEHTTKIIAVKGRRKIPRTPAWLSGWKTVLIPNFLKSWVRKKEEKKHKKMKQHSGSTMKTMNAIMKSLDAKKLGLVGKLFSTFRKRG